MEEALRQDLLAKTKRALDSADWDVDGGDAWRIVERLWQPWVEQGEAEAEFQLAYHYLWCTPCEDDATCNRMKALVGRAAAKDHPDAIWFLATQETRSRGPNPEFERELLRAGQLGSVNAQRELGVMYATGEWSGPKVLSEAVRWYRLAAEKGNAESECDLGIMMLLGEGVPKNIEEGLGWIERAGHQGESLVSGCCVGSDGQLIWNHVGRWWLRIFRFELRTGHSHRSGGPGQDEGLLQNGG